MGTGFELTLVLSVEWVSPPQPYQAYKQHHRPHDLGKEANLQEQQFGIRSENNLALLAQVETSHPVKGSYLTC